MIEVHNLTKRFASHTVLENVTCSFVPGKVNLIIGASGSGKTVLMKCIVGLHEPDEGRIIYDGTDFTGLSHKDRKPIQQKIGMLFQSGALFDSMSVKQNVMFPLNMFSNMTYKERVDRIEFCLNRVNLSNVGHLYPAALSGGMKKRVAIARAIANQPKYLFVDEPNSGLDPQTSLVIDHLIKEITEEFNIVTIVNTHDMNTVVESGANILFIHKGKKWFHGTAAELIRSDNKELNDFVFASKMMRSYREKANQ